MSLLAVLPLAHWVHDLSPFLVRFTDSFGIRYYGLAYLLGFVGSILLLQLYYRRGRSPFGSNTISDLMTYVVLGVLVGGRLGSFLLYQLGEVRTDPLALFRIWEPGMSSHGGMAGVAIALWWFAHRRQVPLLHVSDLVVSTASFGLLLGRVANFINGELWGKHSEVSWAVIFSNTGGGPLPRHPSQLYQALLEGAVLLAFMQWRFWRSDIVRLHPGRLTGEFFLAYAVLRAIGEIFREPDASLVLGLTRGTFYSIFLVAAGVALVARKPR